VVWHGVEELCPEVIGGKQGSSRASADIVGAEAKGRGESRDSEYCSKFRRRVAEPGTEADG